MNESENAFESRNFKKKYWKNKQKSDKIFNACTKKSSSQLEKKWRVYILKRHRRSKKDD